MAVAKHRSFRAAAEELHLSQPALSRRIEKLDTALGVRLFHRTTRKVVLTKDDPVLTRRLTRWVRKAFPELTIVARARDPGHASELYKAGATDAVPETLESSLQLSEAVLVDLGLAMCPVIA